MPVTAPLELPGFGSCSELLCEATALEPEIAAAELATAATGGERGRSMPDVDRCDPRATVRRKATHQAPQRTTPCRNIVALLALLVLALAPRAHAEPLPDRTERVIGLGRVWAKVKFFHPYLAYKDIDWDGALAAAIPKAEAATTVAQYRAAVQGMLAALGDPVTRVVEEPAPDATKPAPTDWLTTSSPGILEIKIAGFVAGGFDYYAGMRTKGTQVVTDAAKVKVLVVDMRASQAQASAAAFSVKQIQTALPAIDEWPLERSPCHVAIYDLTFKAIAISLGFTLCSPRCPHCRRPPTPRSSAPRAGCSRAGVPVGSR